MSKKLNYFPNNARLSIRGDKFPFFFRLNPIKKRDFAGCVQQWCLSPLKWNLKILQRKQFF